MDKSVGYYIKRIGRLIKKHIDNSRYVKDNPDITNVKGFIIGYTIDMNRNGNKVYQKDIERQFKINRSTVSEVLSQMESIGYIERVSDESDMRLKEIKITDMGYKMINTFLKVTDQIDDLAYQGLTDDEKKLLIRIFNRIIENLERKEDDDLCSKC